MNLLDADIQALLDERERTMADFIPGHQPMNMYAIYRADLEMPKDKLASQVGHAIEESMANAVATIPGIRELYRGTGHGNKIIMYSKNLNQLLRGWREAKAAGIPCEIIIDRSSILLPHFTGKPIVTALGIGPVHKDKAKFITNRFTMSKAIE